MKSHNFKKQSLIKGAVILMVANTVSKILGAVFKIPLTYILGEEGMAVFNTAFTVYSFALAFIISGIPLAITKLISEQTALKNNSSVRRIINVSLLLLSAIGLFGTVILYAFADKLALMMNDATASYAIRMISPAVFFVAVGVVYKSYCQGISYMSPIGISQVAEAFIKLAAGYFLALYMSQIALNFAAAGGIAGITVGEIFATAIFIMLCRRPDKIKGEAVMPISKILKYIFAFAAPVMLSSAVSGSLSFADVAMVRTRLCEIVFDVPSAAKFLSDYGVYTKLFNNLMWDMHINADGARWLYGAYSGYALTIFHLPTGIIGALCMGVFPAVSGAAVLGNKNRLKIIGEQAVLMSIILSLPAAAVMYVFPDEILTALFGNCASAPMLRTLAPCVCAVCVAQMCTTILQACGYIKLPIIYCTAACALKLVIGWFLIANPYLNIRGAAVAACICSAFEAACSLIMCRRILNVRPRAVNIVIKPLVAMLVMMLVMTKSYGFMRTILVKDLYALAAVGIMGGIVYVCILWLLGIRLTGLTKK